MRGSISGGGDPGAHFLDLVVGEHAGQDVGAHIQRALAVDAGDGVHLRPGQAIDEVADRHLALGRGHAQAVELVDIAVLVGEAGDDVDLVVALIRPVVAELEAAGDQLNRVADAGDVDAIARRLGAVDVDLPFDAGNRPRILDAHQAIHLVQMSAQRGDGGLEQGRIARRELHIDGLAGRRAGFLVARLHMDAGQALGALEDLRDDLGRGPALIPFGELDIDGADRVLRQVLAADIAGGGLGDGIDGLELVMLGLHGQDLVLDLAHQLVAFVDRQIAAAMDLQQRRLRFDLGEELDALAEHEVGNVDDDQKFDARQPVSSPAGRSPNRPGGHSVRSNRASS